MMHVNKQKAVATAAIDAKAHLVEQAAAQVDTLHLFVLSEDKSFFPAADRMMLVKQGVADLKNVIVHPTGDYLISAATFPTYFIKDKDRIPEIRCQLDLEVFANHFAPALGITRRFVGTEPLSPVTDAYNRQMMDFLPKKGIEVTLVERKTIDGGPISASRVRALLEERKWEELSHLVPATTLEYLQNKYGQ